MKAMATCAYCRYFVSEPAELEQAIPGLNILSSAFGSVRGETGLCRRREVFTLPGGACREFRDACLGAHHRCVPAPGRV